MATTRISYSVDARRSLIAAREEAALRGSLEVRPTHLLLGLITAEDKLGRHLDTVSSSMLARLLRRRHQSLFDLQNALDERFGQIIPAVSKRERPSWSPQLRTALVCARELVQAEASNRGYAEGKLDRIGCDHLLIGLLYENERGSVGTVLMSFGIALSDIEDERNLILNVLP